MFCKVFTVHVQYKIHFILPQFWPNFGIFSFGHFKRYAQFTFLLGFHQSLGLLQHQNPFDALDYLLSFFVLTTLAFALAL